jgi:ADP-heptose:LPS heptosyltransferase
MEQNHGSPGGIKIGNPAGLKIAPPDPYLFKSRFKRSAMKLVDGIGGLLRRPDLSPIPWKSVKRVAVLRLDQMGDVVLALPCLQAMGEALPAAEIDFWMGPWSRDVAELSRLPFRARVFEAPWFSRTGSSKSAWAGYWEFVKSLQEGRYDLIVDLRGDARHHFAGWLAGVPYRMGPNLTGGGFLLTHPVVFDPTLHEARQGLSYLRQAGLTSGNETEFPALFPLEAEQKEAAEKTASWNLSRPVIAVHATCFSTAKQWPAEKWGLLIERLPADFEVVLIGAASEREAMEKITAGISRRIRLAAGNFRVPALTAFLDSGPAHLAAAVGTKTLCLFSGTNRVSQWAPLGKKVVVLQKETVCSPCALFECPIGNECMRLLGVEEVLKEARQLLG